MFIKNLGKKDVKLRSFEGFIFSIQPGTSWIWDKAGEYLLSVHKVESKGGEDKYGFDNGHGLPGLIASTEKDWVKEGKKLAYVERFKIDGKLVPRAKLITTAKQRGLPDTRVMEYLSDPNIDTSEIAQDINALPVPEEVRYPAQLETKEELATA